MSYRNSWHDATAEELPDEAVTSFVLSDVDAFWMGIHRGHGSPIFNKPSGTEPGDTMTAAWKRWKESRDVFGD